MRSSPSLTQSTSQLRTESRSSAGPCSCTNYAEQPGGTLAAAVLLMLIFPRDPKVSNGAVGVWAARGPWSFSVEALYGGRTRTYSAWSYDVGELGLRCSAGAGVRFGLFRLDFEALAAPTRIATSYEGVLTGSTTVRCMRDRAGKWSSLDLSVNEKDTNAWIYSAHELPDGTLDVLFAEEPIGMPLVQRVTWARLDGTTWTREEVIRTEVMDIKFSGSHLIGGALAIDANGAPHIALSVDTGLYYRRPAP